MREKYYMIAKNNSTRSYWEECKSTTEIGAKREASRELGGGYIDNIICIGIELYPGEPPLIVAISEKHGDKWVDQY